MCLFAFLMFSVCLKRMPKVANSKELWRHSPALCNYCVYFFVLVVPLVKEILYVLLYYMTYPVVLFYCHLW